MYEDEGNCGQESADDPGRGLVKKETVGDAVDNVYEIEDDGGHSGEA